MSDLALMLVFTRLPEGGQRVTSPQIPKWYAETHGPFEIAKAIGEAWVEADIAAYARARGGVRDVQAYDAVVDDIRRPTMTTLDPESDVAAPADLLHAVESAEARAARARPVTTYGERELDRARQWGRRADGMWRSPGGRLFREDSEHVRRIAAILAEHGEDPQVIPHLHAVTGGATVHCLDEARARRQVRRQTIEELI